MVKKFFKMAGVTNERDFYSRYPTEEAFLSAYPEAYQMMYGGAYKGGGGIDNPGFRALPSHVQHKIISNMAYGGYYQEGGEQMAPQGGGSQQEQVIQFIVQALQQGAQPEQIVAELAKAGIPEEQGMQLVTAVVQRIQEMQQGAGAAGQMGQEQAQQQFEQASMQPPEYEQEPQPMMKKGGSYSGTYYQGNYFKGGGSMKKYKKGGEYDMSEQEIQDLINKGYKIKYV